MTLSINSKLGELLDNPQTSVILEQHVPTLSTHPQIAIARSMTLREVIPYSAGAVTEGKVLAIEAALAELS